MKISASYKRKHKRSVFRKIKKESLKNVLSQFKFILFYLKLRNIEFSDWWLFGSMLFFRKNRFCFLYVFSVRCSRSLFFMKSQSRENIFSRILLAMIAMIASRNLFVTCNAACKVIKMISYSPTPISANFFVDLISIAIRSFRNISDSFQSGCTYLCNFYPFESR